MKVGTSVYYMLLPHLFVYIILLTLYETYEVHVVILIL